MTLDMTQNLIYGGLMIAGAMFHRFAIAGPPAPPAGSPPTPSLPTPGHLTIGHGQLLSLLMTALATPPPAPLQSPNQSQMQTLLTQLLLELQGNQPAGGSPLASSLSPPAAAVAGS